MKKNEKLEEGIKNIIDYIKETQEANNATEPNAQGLKTMLENLLKK
mgnify:FL=1